MDPELKSKWVAALRSGKYEQITGSMTDRHGGFCCPGVLCVVGGADPQPLSGSDQSYTFCDNAIGSLDTSWALQCMNDRDGKTFPEIADWIEENL